MADLGLGPLLLGVEGFGYVLREGVGARGTENNASLWYDLLARPCGQRYVISLVVRF